MFTEAVPIPPPVVTLLTAPSPKLNVTSLIVEVVLFPLAVKVNEKGASPVGVRSVSKAEQIGETSVVPVPGADVGCGVKVAVAPGTGVGDTAGVLVDPGTGVSDGVIGGVGLGVAEGKLLVGVVPAASTTITAGDAVDNTFSLA